MGAKKNDVGIVAWECLKFVWRRYYDLTQALFHRVLPLVCAVLIAFPETRETGVVVGMMVVLMRDTAHEIIRQTKRALPKRVAVKVGAHGNERGGQIEVPTRVLRPTCVDACDSYPECPCGDSVSRGERS